MEREYEVEVVFRQRAVYRVHAVDRESAERLATAQWQEGRPGVVAGYEWCELESVRAADAPDPEQRAQDAELVLRFLRERERLILRLGGDAFAPMVGDAISAAQVASDLGWARPSGGGGSAGPDVPRATEALEWLCNARRVVCFERPRVRSGERGDIRLYATPEYLERLSEGIDPRERRAS